MERRAEKEEEPECYTVHSDSLAKEDAAADLDWIPVENPPLENHQFFAPASLSSPENQLPPSSENHPFHLSQPEMNPYYPSNYRNTSSINGSSSFSNSLFDTNLEAYFNRLNLDDQTPSFRSSNNMDFSSPQMGLHFDHQNVIQESLLQDFRLDNFSYNYLIHGGQNCHSAMNRYPSTIMPHGYQNSSQSDLTSNFGRFSNGIGADNSSFSGSSSSSSYIYNLLKFFPLEEWRENFCLLAKDRDGSKFLWEKIKEKKPEDVEMVFSEVRDRTCELMIDRIGNDFIRKFFEVCDQQQITQMLLVVLSDKNFVGVCCDSYGTRAVQKLFERITIKEQRCLVVSALLPMVVTLTKNSYGCHVIRISVQSFSSEDSRHIFLVVADNCVEIALDKHGCRVLQKCLDYAQGESKEHLMAEIAANALVLSESQYGNYVVQFILEMRLPHVTAGVLEKLVGSFVSLSTNKYGSNVVETCLKSSGEDEVEQIISEMIKDRNFLGMLQDPFGNYVAQSALQKAKGSLRHTMVNRIQMNYPYLQNHPYGKRVLATTKSKASNHHRRR